MSDRRHLDFSVLGYYGDPLPGDPDEVSAKAEEFAATAENLESASLNLERLDAPSTSSEAVAKILVTSHQLATELALVKGRYDAAAAALRGYAPHLRQAQDTADEALCVAEPATQNVAVSTQAADEQLQLARTSLDEDERTAASTAYQLNTAQADRATRDLNRARAQLQAAIDERDSAATAAASQIDDAMQSSPVNDTLLDHFAALTTEILADIKAVAAWVWEHIDTISTVLDLASMALGWVPFLGPAIIVAARVARLLATIKANWKVVEGIATGVRTGDWRPAAQAAGHALIALAFAKGAGWLTSKAGSYLGHKAGQLAGKAMDGYDAKLKRIVNAEVTKAGDRIAYGQHASYASIAARELNGAAPRRVEYEALELATSRNGFVRAGAAHLDALVGVAKGTDYDVIRGTITTIDHLGKIPDISDATKNVVVAGVEKVTGTIVEEGIDTVTERIEESAQNAWDAKVDHVLRHRTAVQKVAA